MNEPEVPVKKGWGCLQWSVVIVGLVLLGLYMMPCYCCITVRANQMKAGSNARQIIGLLMTYASDNNSLYTDAIINPVTNRSSQTSNEAFRLLVQEGLVQDETIFGCPRSRFMPDRNIGTPPDYKQALNAGENHWMMVAGMTHESPSYYPLIMENAADATWPPKWSNPAWHPEWLAKSTGKMRERGVAWRENKTVIGFNDAAVQTFQLEKKGAHLHLPKRVLQPEGKTPLPVMKLLDIVVSGSGSYTTTYRPKNPDQKAHQLPPVPEMK